MICYQALIVSEALPSFYPLCSSGPPDVPVCTAQIGAVLKGMLVNITSATDFWVQLAGPISKINDTTKACTDNVTEAPEVNTYCAVVLGQCAV